MNKKTVLFIGEGMLCSIEDGMAWHLDIPGKSLLQLLEKKFELLKGGPDKWTLNSDELLYSGEVLSHKFLSESTLGAIFYHKNQPEHNVLHLKQIYSFLSNNFPNVKLLNSPFESSLFRNKIKFSEHVSELPNARSLLPEWRYFESEADLDHAIDTIGFPFLIKPDSLSGGKGIVKIEDKSSALKVLKNSKNGKYHKSNLDKLKVFAKNLISPTSKLKPKNRPIKLIINDYIDTYHQEFDCYINANIYYWMGELHYADARVSHKGFNIHAGDSTNKELTAHQYSRIISEVFRLIERESKNVKEMINSLNQHSIRVDCLINLKEETLKVAEVELKGGPGDSSRDIIVPSMNDAGWGKYRIREYLDGRDCRIDHLFD